MTCACSSARNHGTIKTPESPNAGDVMYVIMTTAALLSGCIWTMVSALSRQKRQNLLYLPNRVIPERTPPPSTTTKTSTNWKTQQPRHVTGLNWTEKYVSKESKSTTAPHGDYWPRSWPETEEKGHLNLSTQHKVHAACLNNQSYFTN